MKIRESLLLIGLAGLALLLLACEPPASEGTPARVVRATETLAPARPTETPMLVPTEPATPTALPEATEPPQPTEMPVPTTTPQTTDSPMPAATPTGEPTWTPIPSPTASPVPHEAIELRSPLVVDAGSGRLYLPAVVDGAERIVALAASDGRLLATYDASGAFAVDGAQGWLYVDRDEGGLSVLDVGSGALHTIVSLPGTTDPWRTENPAPQADPAAGQVLAFRDNILYLVDPVAGAVVDTVPFEVPKAQDCRELDGPLSIEWSAYDSDRRLLYLGFLTYVCTPWYGETVIAYDLDAGAEVGRSGHMGPPTVTAAAGALYGSHWYRFGIGYRWAWHDGQPDLLSGDWLSAPRLYVDPTRGRLYEAADPLQVLDAGTLDLMLSVPSPVAGELVGYDPGTDQLYFLSEGKLHILPARAIQPPSSEAPEAASPPEKPVGRLIVSPGWPQDRNLFGVWDYSMTEGDCYLYRARGGLLYLSGDGGGTWARPRGGLRGGCERISALVASPDYAQDQTLLAGVVGRGLYRTDDGGRLWQPSGAGLASMWVRDIALSPGFARDGTAFVVAGGDQPTLYRSADGGATWQTLEAGVSTVALSPEFDRDGTVMGAACGDPGPRVLLSRDGGDTWAQVGELPAGNCLTLVSLAPLFERWQVVFAHAGDTFYRSADGGGSWTAMLDGISTAQLVYGPETAGGRLLFLVDAGDLYGSETEGRLYRSEDGGQSWQAVELEPGISPTALALSPDFARDGTLFLGTGEGQVIALEAATLAAGQP
jgi:photosystem II stability/assembly factor-like uncharacterized protein